MKKTYIPQEDIDEIEVIDSQLSSEEVFILGFLKGFNRENMRDWTNKGLSIFSQNYYN